MGGGAWGARSGPPRAGGRARRPGAARFRSRSAGLAVALGLTLLAVGCRAHGSEAGEPAAVGCDPGDSVAAAEAAEAAGAEQTAPAARAAGAPDDTLSVAAALAGSWELVLSATEGPRTGAEVRGTLWLAAYGEDAPMAGRADSLTSVVLYGSADVDLEALGALELGGTGSRNPERPGVLVFHRRRAPDDVRGGAGGEPAGGRLLLRLGEDANRADRVLFDGGYTVLRAERWSRDRFGGRWESGVRDRAAAGRFCAVRRAEP